MTMNREAASTRRPGRPRGSKGDDTRRLILDAASACFAEMGFERTTLALVALRSNLTRSAVYNYFDSKESLAQAVLLDNYREVSSTLLGRAWWATPIPAELSTIEKIRFLFEQSLGALEGTGTDSDFYLRVVRTSQKGDEVRSALVSLVHEQRAVFSGLLLEGIANGELSTDLDFEGTLDAIQGLVWALSVGTMTAPNPRTKHQIALGLDLVLRTTLIERTSPTESGSEL